MSKEIICSLLVISTSCASIEQEKPLEELKITDTKTTLERPKAAATLKGGMAPYTYEGKPYDAEWLVCVKDKSKAAVVVMHRDQAGYDSQGFCDGWIAQTFLSADYDVITVNRPGYGKSTGKHEFAGPQSIAAIEAGLNVAKQNVKELKAIAGTWGYSSGVIAATFTAKKLKSFKWLVLGGGIYDAEAVFKQTKDNYIKYDMNNLVKQNGEKVFEQRSIAWDNSELPKKIVMYHAQNDYAAPNDQAKAFRDNLAASEYDVSLEIIDGLQHEIPWTHHRQILEIILRTLP